MLLPGEAEEMACNAHFGQLFSGLNAIFAERQVLRSG